MAGSENQGTALKQSKLKLTKIDKKTTCYVDSELILTDDILKWQWSRQLNDSDSKVDKSEESVRLSWILKAETAAEASGTEAEEGNAEKETSKLTIHYVQRLAAPEYEFTNLQVNFSGSPNICAEWVTLLSDQLAEKVPHRPKSLLIIINPVSGCKKGEKIYKTKVAPLFDIAGIKTEVIATKKAKDSDEIIENFDLTQVDGVVSVGGDGTHMEVISAILHKTMKMAGVDENDPSCNVVPTDIRHGMIPAGTGNGGQALCSFTKEVLTNAIVIALGESKARDILTIHCGQKFLAYSGFMIGYGLMADVLDTVENNRWAGPARFLAAVYVGVIKRKEVELEIRYLPEEEECAEKLDIEKGAGESGQGDKSDEKCSDSSNPGGTNQGSEGAAEIPLEDEATGPENAAEMEKPITGSMENTTEAAEKTAEPGAQAGAEGDQAEAGGEGGDHKGAGANKLKPGWKSFSGKFLGADAFAFKMPPVMDFKNIYMAEHLFPSGVFSVMVTKCCGRLAHANFFRQLLAGKMSQANEAEDVVSLVHVKEYQVTALGKFRDSPKARVIGWDGDILHTPEPHFEVRCHQKVLRNFARLDGEELRNLENERLLKLENENLKK